MFVCICFMSNIGEYICTYVICNNLYYFHVSVMMDEPRFAQPIPNVTVAVGRDANLPCVVEHLGTYKVSSHILIYLIPAESLAQLLQTHTPSHPSLLYLFELSAI